MSRTYKDAKRYISKALETNCVKEERLMKDIERLLWEVSATPEILSKPLIAKLRNKQSQLKALRVADSNLLLASTMVTAG
jgi:hypothetical protein